MDDAIDGGLTLEAVRSTGRFAHPRERSAAERQQRFERIARGPNADRVAPTEPKARPKAKLSPEERVQTLATGLEKRYTAAQRKVLSEALASIELRGHVPEGDDDENEWGAASYYLSSTSDDPWDFEPEELDDGEGEDE